jgi:hypothetical protein
MDVRSYYDASVGVAMEIPAEWDAGSTPDFALILVAPEEQGFHANLSFTVSPFNPPTQERLRDLIEDTRQDREENYPKFSVLREERMILDQCPGYIETYHWEMEDTKVPFFQLYALVLAGQDALYTLHGTSLRALEQVYEPLFRQMIASIRFIRDEQS